VLKEINGLAVKDPRVNMTEEIMVLSLKRGFEMEPVSIINTLIKGLEQMDVQEARRLRQQLLVSPKREEVITTLLHALQDSDISSNGTRFVLRLLQNLQDPLLVDHLLPFLGSKDLHIRKEVICILRPSQDQRAVEPLIASWRNIAEATSLTLEEYQQQIDVWGQAALTLAKMPEYSLQPLLECLHDPDANVRSWTCFALALIASPQTAPQIVPLLHDPEPMVRAQACYALQEIGVNELLPDLLALRHDPDAGVRARVIYALGKLGYGNIAPITESLHDEDAFVRKAAVSVIGRYFPHEAQQYLSKMLEDPDPEVVETTKFYLSRVGKQNNT
jgi:HEAT repeat protein